MNTTQKLDKQTAKRLSIMVESGLIWYKHYFPWTDEIILKEKDLPAWLLNLSTIKYVPDAVEAINEFVYSEPFESFDEAQFSDEFVACLYLQFEINAISWATFLLEAGKHADAYNGRHECEYFFMMLNDYEDFEYSENLRKKQSKKIHQEFFDAITTINKFYLPFKKYFRGYGKKYNA